MSCNIATWCNMLQVERTARTFPGFDKAEAVAYLGHVDFLPVTRCLRAGTGQDCNLCSELKVHNKFEAFSNTNTTHLKLNSSLRAFGINGITVKVSRVGVAC